MSHDIHGTRCAALVGAHGSGKTTLFESLLHAAGMTDRRGTVKDRTTVGDASPEARARGISTEMTLANCRFMDEDWTLIDCPGSVELLTDTRSAMSIADIVVVVADPFPERAVAVSPLLRFLDDRRIPHVIFINRLDVPEAHVRATFHALQALSDRPLALREIPLRDASGQVTGMVDLVSERAWRWNPHKPSDLIPLPEAVKADESVERSGLLEALADFDDRIMEQVLDDMTPAPQEIYASLARDLEQDLVVPVFFGAAEFENGVRRLWKALRHDCPAPAVTAARLGLSDGTGPMAQVIKTFQSGQAGRAAFARVWRGEVKDGLTLGHDRVGSVSSALGRKFTPKGHAGPGEIVVLGRMSTVKAGEVLTEGAAQASDWPEPPAPLAAIAIRAEHPADEAKLSTALSRLFDEDPALSTHWAADTGETHLRGQGDIHLQIALSRLKAEAGLSVKTAKPTVSYRETISKSATFHSRHKKQSGGHGEFADIHVEIAPRGRGEGFQFSDKITGGVVPKQYIPAVQKGVETALDRGPLGFPVVDVGVVLTDGSYHTVDSSDFAFQKAGAKAMQEAMPTCGPVLLEPVMEVIISVPSDFTPRAQRIVTARRGQLLGFDTKTGWKGWDEVSALIPEGELDGLITELRSQTLGVGFYTAGFDHLELLAGREADQVIAARAEALKG
ncbi:elongation factor G [Rhodobacter sp. Har01]|uniref:elongation factor G n=1 Tax=Rhodobacter sp. Har01 TaxID=2883999 RepID=UPI001D07EB5E|nr:elongation factor G [Rhodobacter sp. Har01]MCB6177431.1 elongation factor G [Rhodobacter sp. Har01]